MLDNQINNTYQSSGDIDFHSDCFADRQSILLNDFLYYCATEKLREGITVNNEIDIARYRERFIRAGLTELANAHQQDGWTQLNLVTEGNPSSALYYHLAKFFNDQLNTGIVKNAFFMHKPPGLRIRLQTTQPFDVEKLKQILIDEVQNWKKQQLLIQYQYAVYEPEITLFGGPFSMPWVHQLFTADSLFWLNIHAEKSANRSAIHHLKISLILLRHLFLALQIVDWEDLDVWNKVSDKTGRSMPMEDALQQGVLREVRAAILHIWNEPLTFLSELPAKGRQAIEVLIARFNELGQQWQKNYFQTEHVCIGPRSAAAAYLIFFWNRANINFEQQRIATYALNHRDVLG